ncbi:MAG: thiamine pyrophosphate-dependent enzyme, partial [Bacillota bacterium]|nr:thiamine pyrophosphate-dependent enzyme [Bacillota bacterium]
RAGVKYFCHCPKTAYSSLLPVIAIGSFNNGGYLSIKNTQERYFNGNFVGCNRESGLGLPEIRKIGGAYGLKTMRISNNSEIVGKVRDALDGEGAVLCEVMISPDQKLQPRLSSRVLPDGRLVSSPLEDLSPFLDREEFLAHMLIRPVEE